MKVDWNKVLQGLIVSALIWAGNGLRDLVMTVHDLRRDVDQLYSLVDDVAKEK